MSTDEAARLLKQTRDNPPQRTGHWWDTNRNALIAALEHARREVCCYAGPTCDCKHGLIPGMGVDPRTIGSEHTGCPELGDLIDALTSVDDDGSLPCPHKPAHGPPDKETPR